MFLLLIFFINSHDLETTTTQIYYFKIFVNKKCLTKSIRESFVDGFIWFS